MTNTALITLDTVNDVVDELQTAFHDIPFENSDFQNENFVIAAQITPERAYRAIGLRMFSKIQALKEAKYGRLKEDIDIEELQAKIADPATSSFDVRRAELDIQQKLENRDYTNKLINDAIHELNLLYTHFNALPKFTREQFESGERSHFEQRLQRQMQGIQGASESLSNMVVDAKSLATYVQQQKQLSQS
jgi:hypothetical protein